jgi:hypothetical protein
LKNYTGSGSGSGLKHLNNKNKANFKLDTRRELKQIIPNLELWQAKKYESERIQMPVPRETGSSPFFQFYALFFIKSPAASFECE